MARKPKSSPNSSFTPISFVQCTLSSEEKKHFQAWMKKSADDLNSLVVEVLQSNHKMGFSYNDSNDSFVCSITGKQEDCINASKCFTSHGKDYQTALWVSLYKFHVLWQKGVWEEVEDAEDFG